MRIWQICIPSCIAFFVEETETSSTTESMFILLKISGFWLIYNLWKKYSEKNLKKIETGLSEDSNIGIIVQLMEMENLELVHCKENYFEFHIPSWMNGGCKLVLIADENQILYNVRIKDTGKGRPQNTFGYTPYQKLKIKRQIMKCLIQE